MTTTRPSTPDLPPVPGKRYFTLSEMCALTGVAPELLRQWEATGMSFGRQPGSRPRQHYQHHDGAPSAQCIAGAAGGAGTPGG